MTEQNYKVLITTSGIGSRLGELTKNTNQTLIRLLKKPILSHIIELYPKDVEIVVTLGYFGNLVKEFLEIAYPDRKFTFVNVDKYQGPGTSQGYSMLQAKDQLQCPFIFHAGDTVVMETVPSPLQGNWCGGSKGEGSQNYAAFTELDERVLAFFDKGTTDFDYLYIGLVGIKDYERFWEILEKTYKSNPNDGSLGDVPVMEQMIQQGSDFTPREFTSWLDIGNLESLNNARKKLGEAFVNLDKEEEATYIFEEKCVIKFMSDTATVANRIKRAEILRGLVPALEASSEHFYRYKYMVGRLYSRVVTPSDFAQFLEWSKKHLWQPKKEVSDEEFKKLCQNFYKDKTLKRIQKFYESTGLKDKPLSINGEKVPSLEDVFSKIDFEWLSSGIQTGFHGDFILDNIIRTQDSYKLLDWRQDFGGLIASGDYYYDLAKMNHNLTINHDMVFKDLYTIKVRGSVVFCDILRPQNLIDCQAVLWKYIEENKLDLKKVKILTAMAWLNSAPLHQHPYNYFLHYFGRLNLFKALEK